MSEFKTNKISPRKGTTTTIGDSGDTIATGSGTTLNIQGTYSGINVIEWDTTAKTANFTAETNKGYFIDTSSGGVTVTLPATPVAGSFIGIKDYALTAQTNNIRIGRNGNNIQGAASDVLINTQGGSANLVYVDSTQGWLTFDAAQASDIAETPSFITATGGTETTCGDYKIHTFTGPGTFTVTQIGNAPTIPTGGPNTIDYMVVAGGAGGGNFGGGGGSGGWRASDGTNSGCYSAGPAPLVGCVSGVTASITAYPITVGAGGGGGGSPTGCGNRGASGSNSVFSTITSAGGGGGGGTFAASNTGGSGGGGGFSPACGANGNTPPVSPPQGNDGGDGATGDPYSRGGGGGSGGTGGNAGPNNVAGNGANGVASCISASPVTYAGGGGGGSRPSGYPATAGSGGTGGGGAGGQGTDGTNGTANTGGGGGGGGQETPSFACQTGGSGGSGIVIIRYKYQ